MTFRAALAGIRMPKQGTCMACGERPILDFPAHRLRQLQQAHRVGDMAARLADGTGQLVMRQAEFTDQALQPVGLLDRVEVLSLQVLDQGRCHRIAIVKRADVNRHVVQPGQLGGPPTALTGDDLVDTLMGRIWTCEDRLQDATRADRGPPVRRALPAPWIAVA